MSSFELPDLAIGVLLAAILTATFSVISLVISKETGISEFRQKWIDELRGHISQVIAQLQVCHSIFNSGLKQKELDPLLNESTAAFSLATAQIRLRLNPEEEINQKLLSALKKAEDHIGSRTISGGKAHADLEEAIVHGAQSILKMEWTRVKRGEAKYRIALWCGSLMLAIASILVVSSLVGPSAAPAKVEVQHPTD